MNRSGLTASGVLLAILLLSATATARGVDKGERPPEPQIQIDKSAEDRLGPGSSQVYGAAAAQSTTWLAYYTFDSGPNCVTEGWISVDRTAQTHDFWHVDDFAGLGGGDFGRLVPLQGAQSMWCGARPDPVDVWLCGYAALPGYGNGWNQALCSATCLAVTSDVEVSLSVAWDSEPGYDATILEVDNCDDAWQKIYGDLGTWDGIGTDTLTIAVADSLHSGDLRFRFHFISDGAWSDADGQWSTDGAYILDELSVTDSAGTVVAYEDFEDESVGDNDADDWVSCTPPGYGDYAALYKGYNIVQEDPCTSDLDCMWTFYTGSTYDYSCGGWPTQLAVPYENSRGQYIRNEVWSPEIPISGTGSAWELRFDVYRDLHLGPLVFYTWHVSSITGACPSTWRDYGFVYYGGGKDWLRATFGFGSFVEPGASHIRVALGARDMCYFWGGVYGDCLCHTHAPLFDDVEVYRIGADGPQWQVRDLDLFQDTFAEDGTITGTARADAANDILPGNSAAILPGDSVSVTVSDPESGLGFHVPGDPASGPAVYCYVRVDGANETTPGAALVDDPRYDVVGTVSAGGRSWTQIQMDSSYTSSGSVVADDYNIDLNDNLFVPGDTVWFFFGARSAPPSSNWTYFSLPVRTPSGQTDNFNRAAVGADEFTVLPTGAQSHWGKSLLYVDGMNFRGRELSTDYGVNYKGHQVFWDWAFIYTNATDMVDRYDIRGPSSAVGNHPGARVRDIIQQITQVYKAIVWDCGNLTTALGDGTGTPDKSDDTGLLFTFLNHHTGYGGGVYLCGDDVADEWLNTFTGASATQLRTTYVNFNVVTGNHVPSVGINPLGVGTVGGVFEDTFGPDSLIVFGGCRLINDFDVINPQGAAVTQMEYHGKGNTRGAVVSQVTENAQGEYVGFMLSGFSLPYIRDIRPAGILARAEHLHRILNSFLLILLPEALDVPSTGFVNSLAHNYPNPFNPTTTISYTIAERGQVSLKVYNVAGQLVRTLVDDIMSPEAVEPVRWSGLNNQGQAVSSGVYFYKLTTKGFTQTKKMVLLK
jgi:hypothetical protein